MADDSSRAMELAGVAKAANVTREVEVRAKIAIGLDDARAGRVIDGDEALAAHRARRRHSAKRSRG